MKLKNLLKYLTIVFALLLTSCDLFSNSELIVLNEPAVTLNLADVDAINFTLQPTLVSDTATDDVSFTYKTSNYDVASVSAKGVITAKSVGTATITVSVDKKSYLKATCSVTVIDALLPKVKLDKTEVETYKGNFLTLNASVYNTEDTNIFWTSSNLEIATVTNGLVAINENAEIGSEAKITAALASDSKVKSTCLIKIVEKPLFDYDYTVMFYLSGNDLEYDSTNQYQDGALSADIKEILQVKYPSNVKVIIETGGAKKWRLDSAYIEGATSISASSLQRWEVSSCSTYNRNYNNKIKLVETLSGNNLATQDAFESFLKWGLRDYNGAKMGVVLSGHGAGIAGCCFDANSYNNGLINSEIALASRNALQEYNRNKFTFIGYDCCVMATADAASTNAAYYECMIASQETELGDGWDHDVWLNKIAQSPSISEEALCESITSSFVKNSETYCGYSTSEGIFTCYSTLAAYDLSKMDKVSNLFNSYISDVGATYDAFATKYVQAYISSKLTRFGGGIYGLVDFDEFLEKMSTLSEVETLALRNAIDELVICNHFCSKYSKTYGKEPCGLSLFIPYCSSNYFQVTKADYSGQYATNLTVWQDLCLNKGVWNRRF